MSILEAMELGQVGQDINELLNELKQAVKSPEDFDNHDHQMEYTNDTIIMIQNELTKLKLK